MQDSEKRTDWNERVPRGVAKATAEQRDAHGFTPEMRAIADALVNPEGDPYDNARKLGFYCEQCG